MTIIGNTISSRAFRMIEGLIRLFQQLVIIFQVTFKQSAVSKRLIPILIVMAIGVASVVILLTLRRNRCANVLAYLGEIFGRITTNSSPPKRATKSEARIADFNVCATEQIT